MESQSPKKGPHRERFFSSMNYEQYQLHFGPPKPLLKPSADPQIDIEELKLDDSEETPQNTQTKQWNAMGFGRARGFTLPVIKQSKLSEEASNYDTDKRESSIVQAAYFKRERTRMRSNSQNPNLLILSLLDRAQRMQKCTKAEQPENTN